ncbi:hypothetical protein BJV82DRAFT_160385 [Fennellomyces sp. T-0311]|nr:hypothetical protein BJV82DRAFT_160385 [Fennellomyces sp. T-0311]
MIMVAMNHYITLDIGYKMQVRASWLKYLALGSWTTVVAVLAILVVQIVFVLVQQDREFTIRWMFIFGVCMAIVGACCAFFFSFWPLIRWRKNRTQEAHSRTTAYGIWYLSIDGIWYSLYGVLYVWFFAVNTWDQFNNMLAADYTMRFVLCLMFTWPPPKWIIDCVSSQLSSQGNNLQTVPGTLSQNIPDTYMPSMLSEDRFVYDEEHKMGSRIAMVTTQKPEATYANPTYANPTYANPAFANSTYPDKPV